MKFRTMTIEVDGEEYHARTLDAAVWNDVLDQSATRMNYRYEIRWCDRKGNSQIVGDVHCDARLSRIETIKAIVERIAEFEKKAVA